MKAFILKDSGDGNISGAFGDIDAPEAQDEQVVVDVHYSTINYKDAMILNNNLGRLVRNFPHVPGIDFAGAVSHSNSADFKRGDRVVLTGWHVGERTFGGYAEQAVVPAKFLVKLPDSISTKEAAAIGTAGFTAMLAIDTIELVTEAMSAHGMKSSHAKDKPILVTGASGGVGSVAVLLLSALGYQVAAMTGRAENEQFLRTLGAQQIVERSQFEGKGKPLESENWGGAIDNVGGEILARVLTQIAYGGTVAAVGLAGSAAMSGTVMPFLLRAVKVLGIDSVQCPAERRKTLWQRLDKSLERKRFAALVNERRFDELPELAAAMLKGQVRGRVVFPIAAH